MITRLPRWIEYGAFLLAWIAGCLNVVGLLGFDHLAISHVSGTTTLVGAAVIVAKGPGVGLLIGILAAFFAGAVVSGLLLRDTALRLDRHYDTALATEALLIFAAFALLSWGSFLGYLAAAMACGVQNALATTYSGAIVRTTHLTGIFTDLGIMVGSFLRGKPFGKRKAMLFVLIISGFITGGAVGAVLFQTYAFAALLVPATLCALLAIAFRVYKKRAISA